MNCRREVHAVKRSNKPRESYRRYGRIGVAVSWIAVDTDSESPEAEGGGPGCRQASLPWASLTSR